MSTEKFIIIKKFSVLSPSIINERLLEEYVDFCLEHRKPEKITKKTTSHHILPMAKTLPFKEWSDLNIHSWNKAELLYSDHYRAHYLLMKAVDHIATYHAFSAMHKKDFSIGRITESDLISDKEFNEIWTKRNEMVSKRRLEKIVVDGEEMTRATYYAKTRVLSEDALRKMSERVSGDNNPTKMDGVVDKIRLTKLSTFIDDKNLDRVSAERVAETMKKEFISANGSVTTIYKENGKKISKTLLELEENGKTKAYNKNKVIHQKLRQKGKWYKVMNVFDETFEKVLPAAEVRKLSPGLESCSRDNYFGKSKYGSTILKKRGKQELIGLFVERIE